MPVYLDERFDLVSLNRPKRRPKTHQAFATLSDALAYAHELATKLKGQRSVSIERRGLWPVVRWSDPKGITALELLVVLAITGVLLALAAPIVNPAPTAARVLSTLHAAERWAAKDHAIIVYRELPATSCPPEWTCAVRGQMPVPGGFLHYVATVTDPQGHSTVETR